MKRMAKVLVKGFMQIGKKPVRMLPDTLVITLMSLLAVVCFDLSFFDPSSLYQADNENGISADFIQRIKYRGNRTVSDIIKTVNVGEIEDRAEIGKLLERIYSHNPEAIGVDIEFRGLKNKAEDSCLVQSIKRIKDKTVFAASMDKNNKMRHSFFCDSTLADTSLLVSGVEEGLASFMINSFEESIRSYQMEITADGSSKTAFAAKLSKLNNLTDTLYHLIRYEAVEFQPLVFNNHDDNVNFDGCYVIVGEFLDGIDIFNTPVGILHGATIHAHVLNTILNGDIEETDNLTEIWYTALTCFVLALLLVSLDVYANHISKRHPVLSFWLNESGVTVLLLSIALVILLVSFAYYKFHNDNVYISLNDALISVAIATGLVKSIWTGIVLLCRKKTVGGKILRYSNYYNIEI